MANKQLVFQNAVRDLATGQFFDLIFIDGGGTYNLFVRDAAQPPTQPANVAQITSVGGSPVIAPGGVGNVTGLGTTGRLPKWTNGPGSVVGDSLWVETPSTLSAAALLTLTLASNTFLIQPSGTSGVLQSGIGTNSAALLITPGVGTLLQSAVAFVSSDPMLAWRSFLNTRPGLKSSSTTLKCRLADDSGDAPFTAASLLASLLTANAFLFSGAGGLLTATAAPTDGQLLIGDTGGPPLVGSLASGDATIIITLGAGTIDLGTIGTVTFLISQSATPLNLTAANSQTTYTNEGAAAQIVVNLPAAAAGLTFEFIVQDADGIQVDAQAGDTIRLGASVSSSGGTATSTTIGSTLRLIAINATEWIATSIVGTWVTA